MSIVEQLRAELVDVLAGAQGPTTTSAAPRRHRTPRPAWTPAAGGRRGLPRFADPAAARSGAPSPRPARAPGPLGIDAQPSAPTQADELTMTALYDGIIGSQAQSKMGHAAAFWGCLLTIEAVTCLGLLASFDHVAQVENQITTWPALHAEWCEHTTSPSTPPDSESIAQLPCVSAGVAGVDTTRPLHRHGCDESRPR